MEPFQSLESAVRSYSRSFPAVFDKATGSFLYDRAGRRYIDFLAGAGALNYGHNNPRLKRALLEYIERDGITHSLDLATEAKRIFIERFQSVILRPRDLTYRFQFTGPTGANGVEAALKLARKVTSRRNVVSFTRAFHGLSGGALAVTANSFYRGESYVNRADVSFLPYDGYYEGIDTIPLIAEALTDFASGIDSPAAVIVETVQGEGTGVLSGLPKIQAALGISAGRKMCKVTGKTDSALKAKHSLLQAAPEDKSMVGQINSLGK